MLEIGWVDNERYFDGIDEVKLWNRALSRDELIADPPVVELERALFLESNQARRVVLDDGSLGFEVNLSIQCPA